MPRLFIPKSSFSMLILIFLAGGFLWPGVGWSDLAQDRESLGKAIQADDQAAVEALAAKPGLMEFKDEKGNTPLFTALLLGQEAVAILLVETGAQVDVQPASHGLTPLMVACAKDMERIVPKLLAKGVNVNARGLRGQTALYLAVFSGNSQIVSHLLEAGADPNLSDDLNQAPLYLASLGGHVEMVSMLLEKGADVHAKTGEMDHDALMAASINGEYEIAKMLMDKDAKFHVQDKQGMTALMFASQHGHADIVNLMLGRYAHPMITPFVESMEFRDQPAQ